MHLWIRGTSHETDSRRSPARRPPAALLGGLSLAARADGPGSGDPAVVPTPWHAGGFPSRDPKLDALPGFRNPPPGYGEVPYWWWTGDSLDMERLTWQLDQLHQKGISGMQVNYAHEDSDGWPTYAAEPPIFSDPWWRIWGRIADECRKRGMGIGLSTYTLDWTGADNLFRQLFYSKPLLNALKLQPLPRQRLKAGQSARAGVPSELIAARVYRVDGNRLQSGGVDLIPLVRDGGRVPIPNSETLPRDYLDNQEMKDEKQVVSRLVYGLGCCGVLGRHWAGCRCACAR